ncbi:DUF4214 domain-containing protein [Ectopseudomonas oleovorans]|uniref:DUF4214 domain-containing protein n=1 Tax=Ectopseudomonas oleovorans TaxID=301 RepID=UPI00244CD90E|nr:DUF4214 domain-containing protein [Pseudomonas oleovorans]MDG9977495.1 DUF4214 domain-containing protein [Pseudomonas oleovorans]
MATVSDLQQLYIGYFGRAADQAGLNFWLGAINNDGLSLANVHAAFVNSDEYNAQYEGLTVSQKVAAVYQNVLGRAADAEGQAFWTKAIEDGTITEDQLIEGLLSGLSPKDALIVSNKIVVANYFTSVKGANYAEADKAESSNILAGVDETVTSVSAALTQVGDFADDASTADLAAALAALEAAQEAQLAYAKALLNDEDGTVADANIKVAADLSTAESDLVAVVPTFSNTDSTALTNLKIKEAQDAATKAVADARIDLASTAGLPALVTKFNSQLATYEAATKTAAAASTEQNAELAKFNVVNGNTTLTVDGDGLVTGVIEKNASGQLVLTAQYSGTNAATSAAQKEAAEALLADVKAFQAASKAVTAANTALDATGDQIAAAGADTYDAATNTFTGGPVKALQDALAAQTALNKAVTAYNEAKATAAEWKAVSDDVIEAYDAFTDIGYSLVDVIADVPANGQQDVFVFSNLPLNNNSAAVELGVEAGDVLFIGSNYKLGTDSNPATTTIIEGGDNSAFEVFFQQDGLNAKVLVENSVFGSSVAGGGEFTTITLTGVNVDQLSFDAQTGLISIAAA